MYEKNADIMDSLRNAKNSVADGAMSLLQKLKGSSQNDIDNAVSSQLPSNISAGISGIKDKVHSQLPSGVRQVVDNLRSQTGGQLADKAEKALADLKVPSALSYIPGIGGYLGGLSKPTPGRGRFVSALGEGVSGNLGGTLGGASGAFGGAALGGIGALLAKVLSKGRINLGREAILGGAIPGGMVGNSLGTHAGAGLFHDMAAKSAELIGDQEELDVNNNGKIEGVDLANLRKGKKLSKDKTKFAEWTPAPSFSANMAMPNMAMPNKTNPFLQGKKTAPKANIAGIQAAQDKLASQDNCSPSRSSAGDSKGVKYKQQTEDHATGTAAFDSLDKYLRMAKKAALESSDKKKKKIKWYGITLPEDQKRMAEEKYDEMNSSQDNKNKAMAMDKYKEMSKKAGLNDFQTNFFGRLIQEGINEHEMYEAVKQAGDQFGAEVGKELNRGLKKLGFAGLGAIGKGLNGDTVHRVQSNIPEPAGNQYQAVRSNIPEPAGNQYQAVRSNMPEPAGNQYQAVMSRAPETNGNPLQNMANAGMQHFGNMANNAVGMMGGAANGAGQQNSGFNPLQHMPRAGGAFGGANKVNGLGVGFTGNGMGKQSREKKAVNWAGMAQAAAKYLGTGLARPGAAVKKVYDAAKSVGSAGPSMPSISNGIKGVLNDKTMRSQMWTGAGTGATNPFTGMFTPSDDPNAGWGDYAARVGGSALAGAGAGLLGGTGVQDVMKRMYAGSLAGSTADLGAGAFGIDTGGLGGKIGFLGAGASPAKMPKFLGARANRFAGGYDPANVGGFTVPGRQGDTLTALSKLDPFSLVGNGYTKFVKPNVRPALDAMKANKGLTAGIGLGTAGIGTGAYIGNKAVSGINDASERMNAQMNMLRNETHNNLSGIRQDLGGGMGGIGQFFEENKHWLMPALLAGGGALAGGALGGQSGAAMGGLSLPALYMMHQNGMFGGGGAANPLQAAPAGPAKANYVQRQQQHEQEQINDQIAARSQDPRLASPTAPPSKPYMGTGVMPNFPPKPKTAGDRAVRLMRHFAKN